MDNCKLDVSEIDSIDSGEYEGSLEPPTIEAIGYHFRFTFSDQDKELKCLENPRFINRCRLIQKSLLSKMFENNYFHLGKYISGFETRNNSGEHCKAHMHIAFYSTCIKQSINRTIKRYLENDWEQDYVGNSAYSFKAIHIRNLEEFWRYPIKQSLDLSTCRGFAEDKLKVMFEIAYESWQKTCQINQSKIDKRDKDDTLFQRVFSKIKKENLQNLRSIAKKFVEHYLEEDRPINKLTIQGYTINAALKLNLMSVDEYLDTYDFH